jgi:hypothetical protein
VLTWATALGRRYCRRWVSLEAAAGAEADQDGNGEVCEPLRHVGRIVAGVENDEGRGPIGSETVEQVFELFHRNRRGILVGMQALDIDRGGPGVRSTVELGQPPVRPSSDNQLTSGVARRMLVVAALGTRFSVAARPDAQVDGVDRMLGGRHVPRQQPAQSRHVEVPLGKAS